MNFIDELTWRGMIHQMMPGTKEQLEKEMTTAYLGIDPTADSLHIGHLVGVMMLKHFQRSGHKPIALVGGATGMIGDPSMKSQERKLLDEETLRHNQEAIKKQLSKFLDFDSDEPNAAEMVNNYDWMKNFSFLDFIRDVGKHITVNYMMAKDSVKKRLSGESQQGMSFTEFSYQLVQGYDFLNLYREKNCKLQLGGSDQWGNITTGTELIRRTLSGGDALHRLDEETLLQVMDGVPQHEIAMSDITSGELKLVDLLTDKAPVFPSKGEMRKMAQQGGLSINKEKVTDPYSIVTADMLLAGKYILAQRGKKNYFLLIAK